MDAAERHAAAHGGEHAEPGRAGFVGRRIGEHGAEHERALVAEVDAPGLLGEALADADKQERRAYA